MAKQHRLGFYTADKHGIRGFKVGLENVNLMHELEPDGPLSFLQLSTTQIRGIWSSPLRSDS